MRMSEFACLHQTSAFTMRGESARRGSAEWGKRRVKAGQGKSMSLPRFRGPGGIKQSFGSFGLVRLTWPCGPLPDELSLLPSVSHDWDSRYRDKQTLRRRVAGVCYVRSIVGHECMIVDRGIKCRISSALAASYGATRFPNIKEVSSRQRWGGISSFSSISWLKPSHSGTKTAVKMV